jgi:hypothetical protein
MVQSDVLRPPLSDRGVALSVPPEEFVRLGKTIDLLTR